MNFWASRIVGQQLRYVAEAVRLLTVAVGRAGQGALS
jgi:hypothetical protein